MLLSSFNRRLLKVKPSNSSPQHPLRKTNRKEKNLRALILQQSELRCEILEQFERKKNHNEITFIQFVLKIKNISKPQT